MSVTKLWLLQDGETHCLNDQFNIKILDIRRESPNLQPNNISMMGSDGERFVNADFAPFNVHVTLILMSRNNHDYHLLVNELRTKIFKREPYFIIHNFEPGKRFKVLPQSPTFARLNPTTARVDLVFRVFRGSVESVWTTLQAVDLDYNWQFSMGLVAEDFSFTHRTRSFEIWNFGDFTVDPREHPELTIRIEGVSEGEIELFNQTTGERFLYHPPMNSNRGEFLTIEGVYPKLNGRHVGIDTNGGLISIAPGRNEIQMNGIAQLTVSFEFRFRYV